MREGGKMEGETSYGGRRENVGWRASGGRMDGERRQDGVQEEVGRKARRGWMDQVASR